MCIAILCIVNMICRGEVVDPRHPHELQDPVVTRPAWWLPTRIRQLEAEEKTLLESLARLPRHDPKYQFNQLGYHSLISHSDRGKKPSDFSIRIFTIDRPLRLGSIALSPALNPFSPSSNPHAFPRRFKIEVMDEDSIDYEVVVDWMDEDFPDPGPYPVFFADINRSIVEVRITVPNHSHASGAAYFTLGEIFLFEEKVMTEGGDNMMLWDIINVQASGSFSMPQLWDVKYLNDGITGFGLPVSDVRVDQDDLLFTFDPSKQKWGKVNLNLDLGRGMNVNRVEFWPAEAPDLMTLPSFGFPKRINVKAFSGDKGEFLSFSEKRKADEYVFRDQPFTVYMKSAWARRLHITMDGFGKYKGRRILGLGEIRVYGGKNKDVVSPVSIKAPGQPQEFKDQLPRLFDGCSQHRRIFTQEELIKGLSMRRPIDRRLAVVREELSISRTRLRRMQQHAGIGTGCLLFTGLTGGMILQRRQRRTLFLKLKRRITRDLHDEVGSILGSISLTADQLEKQVPYSINKQKPLPPVRLASDISLLAREASASLREVVWLTDQEQIMLPALLNKLIERAQRVLIGTEVVIDMPSACPDTIVSMTVKRHLIMLFKEIVHNCAIHARATRVHIVISVTLSHLEIQFEDNGRGFDTNQPSSGWGLSNMRERAEELKGEILLTSRPNAGTTVVLKIPMESLNKEPGNAYSTSN